jgi:hypothetical protein
MRHPHQNRQALRERGLPREDVEAGIPRVRYRAVPPGAWDDIPVAAQRELPRKLWKF